MSENIKKGDFIELEYTGKLKEDGTVFDTTDKTAAKAAGIHNDKMEYGPIVVCVGEQHVLGGLDKGLEGKEAGNSYDIELQPEDAFGRKNVKLVQLVSTSKFTKQGINPVMGLQVNIDGIMGMIKNVSGGRTLVDFNHPLAGRELIYSVKINRIVTDDAVKIKALLKLTVGKGGEVSVENKKATISMKIPKEVSEKLAEEIKKLLPALENVEFKEAEKAKE